MGWFNLGEYGLALTAHKSRMISSQLILRRFYKIGGNFAVNAFSDLFNCMQVGRASDLMMDPA